MSRLDVPVITASKSAPAKDYVTSLMSRVKAQNPAEPVKPAADWSEMRRP